MNPYRLRAYVLLLSATAIWAIASPIIKFTLGGLSPLPFLAYRFGISALIAVFAIAMTGGIKFPKDPKTLATLLFYSVLTSSVSLGLIFFGLEKTTVLDSTLISAVDPLIIAATGVIFLREHVTLKEKLGMGIAFIGTFVTVVGPLFGNGNGIKLSGNLLIVIYLFVNALAVLLAKKLVRLDITPLTLTNFTFIVGFLTTLPLAIFSLGTDGLVKVVTELPLKFHLGVLYMAVFSGSLAYTLWARAQKTIEIGEAAVFAYLYPVLAAPLAILWLDEKITLPLILGAAIISIGVVIAEVKKKRYN